MASLKDIAKEANVSVTTVANVIHGNHKRVAKETVDRINEIVQRTNYVPNMTARSLVKKFSKIIGVINYSSTGKKGNFISDPFYSAVIAGIKEELREKGYFLMIWTVFSEEDLFSLFRNWNMDGLILIGAFKDKFYEKLIDAKVPLVLIDSYVDNKKILI